MSYQMPPKVPEVLLLEHYQISTTITIVANRCFSTQKTYLIITVDSLEIVGKSSGKLNALNSVTRKIEEKSKD